MRAVGALAASRLQEPRLARGVKHAGEQALASLAAEQPTAELAQDAVVEAGVGEVKGEQVFPIDARPHRVGGLPVGEPFAELHQRDPGQPPGRVGRLAERRVEVPKGGIVEQGAEPVAHEQVGVAARERGSGDALGLFGNRRNRAMRAKGHGRYSSKGRDLNAHQTYPPPISPTVSARL